VPLLVHEDAEQAAPEFRRRFGKGEERPGEQLDRLQLVIGEGVEDARALCRIQVRACSSKRRRVCSASRHSRNHRPRRGQALIRISCASSTVASPASAVSVIRIKRCAAR